MEPCFFVVPNSSPELADYGIAPDGAIRIDNKGERPFWNRQLTAVALATVLQLHAIWYPSQWDREPKGDRASLDGARLVGARLVGASLVGASLDGARLDGASLPDGRDWETYKDDHLAGLCSTPEIVAKATEAWGGHDWGNCPMHAAYGIKGIDQAPEDKRIAMAAWVALYDARLLESPRDIAMRKYGGDLLATLETVLPTLDAETAARVKAAMDRAVGRG